MVSLQETFGSKSNEFDATLLSDGTLRVLSIAAAILTAAEGSLVVIEEIDNGVHPSRAETLLKSISTIAKRRKLSVLISSHNPALLDALPNDAVPDVAFCYRDPNTGDSKLVRLEDVPDYPELIAQGSVGHLMTTGLIERFVKTHPGPEARRRKSQHWLESLRNDAAE
jgi:predicted ATPase